MEEPAANRTATCRAVLGHRKWRKTKQTTMPETAAHQSRPPVTPVSALVTRSYYHNRRPMPPLHRLGAPLHHRRRWRIIKKSAASGSATANETCDSERIRCSRKRGRRRIIEPGSRLMELLRRTDIISQSRATTGSLRYRLAGGVARGAKLITPVRSGRRPLLSSLATAEHERYDGAERSELPADDRPIDSTMQSSLPMQAQVQLQVQVQAQVGDHRGTAKHWPPTIDQLGSSDDDDDDVPVERTERGNYVKPSSGDKSTWTQRSAQTVNLNELTISKARQRYDYICIDWRRRWISPTIRRTRKSIRCGTAAANLSSTGDANPHLHRLMAADYNTDDEPTQPANQRLHLHDDDDNEGPTGHSTRPHYNAAAAARHYLQRRQRRRHYQRDGHSEALLITAPTARAARTRRPRLLTLLLLLLAAAAAVALRTPSITAPQWDGSMQRQQLRQLQQQQQQPLPGDQQSASRPDDHDDEAVSIERHKLVGNKRDHNRPPDDRCGAALDDGLARSGGRARHRGHSQSQSRQRRRRRTLDDNNDNKSAAQLDERRRRRRRRFDKISSTSMLGDFLAPKSADQPLAGYQQQQQLDDDDGCTYIEPARQIRADRPPSRPPFGRRPSRKSAVAAESDDDDDDRATASKAHSGHDRRARRSSSGSLRAREFALAAAAASGSQQQHQLQQQQQQLCPPSCLCLWKNGKQSADCSAHSLDRVPSGLDPLLQVLNLSANHLVELPKATFASLNLNNLQRIYMSSCQMESLHVDTFERLKSVVELDLSWNKLTFVPLAQLRHLSLLRKLVMRGNPLLMLNARTLSAANQHQSLPSPPPEVALRLIAANPKGTVAANMSRLFEAFPELGRALVRQRFTTADYEAAVDDNLIIRPPSQSRLPVSERLASGEPNEQELLEALRRIVQLERRQVHLEADAEADLNDNDDNDNNNEDADDNSSQQADDYAGDEWAGLERASLLGAHFAHMQELDFGQCRLSYITWNTFAQLRQLKRLLLDGNQLSQLSGRLVSALPVGLHQLSLEENPWRCDCRLAALKRWLLSTRTPLRAPVRCLPVGVAELPTSPLQPPPPTVGKRRLLTVDSQPLGAVLVLDSSNNNNSNGANNSAPDLSSGGAKLHRTQQHHQRLLDKLTLDDFVCAPQVNLAAQTNFGDDAKGAPSPQPILVEHRTRPALSALYEYLAPVLPTADWLGGNGASVTAAQRRLQSSSSSSLSHQSELAKPSAQARWPSQPHNTVLAIEDQRVTLNCSFIAYPAESLDVIWLVNYNHQRHHQSSADTPEGGAELQRFSGASSRLPAEERFVVLYDSKLHRLSQLAGGQSSNAAAANNSSDASSEQPVVAGSAASNDNHQQHLSEVSLYGNRLLVRETRHSASPLSATFDNAAAAAESILKESQVIIQAAHVDDSARYKCIAVNSAGNASVEHLLRVSRSPNNNGAARTSALNHMAAARDQRAQTSGAKEEPPRSLATQGSQVTGGGGGGGSGIGSSPSSPGGSSSWLKSSTAFQISMVVVSGLMGAVIVAFLLFCIVIYQIKPSFNGAPLAASQSTAALGGKRDTLAAQLAPAHHLTQVAHLTAPAHHSVAVVNSAGSSSSNGSSSNYNYSYNSSNNNNNNNLAANHQTNLAANGSLPVYAHHLTAGQRRLIMPSAVSVAASGAGAARSPPVSFYDAHQQQQQQVTTFTASAAGNQTPLLTAVCDPLTGQSPLHLLLHPTAQVAHVQQQQLMSQANNRESTLTWYRQPMTVDADHGWAHNAATNPH